MHIEGDMRMWPIFDFGGPWWPGGLSGAAQNIVVHSVNMFSMYVPKIRALASISIVSIKSKECHLRQSARFYHISSINVIKTLEVHLRLQIQRCRL